MADFDINKLIGSPSLESMPEAVRDLMKDLLEGNVRQYVIIAEMEDGTPAIGYHVLNDQEMNPFAMSGFIQAFLRDYNDTEVPSIMGLFIEQDQGEDDDAEGE